MLDHISFGVSDLARSIAFYDAVLAQLGFVRLWSASDAAGYGYLHRNSAPCKPLRGATQVFKICFSPRTTGLAPHTSMVPWSALLDPRRDRSA